MHINIRIEQAYKGNYHLLADIDGKERKFVITKTKDEYAFIQQAGLSHLSEEFLRDIVLKYLLRN